MASCSFISSEIGVIEGSKNAGEGHDQASALHSSGIIEPGEQRAKLLSDMCLEDNCDEVQGGMVAARERGGGLSPIFHACLSDTLQSQSGARIRNSVTCVC